MKNWKALTAGFLVLCLLLLVPETLVFSEEYSDEYSEEYYDEEPEEDPIPDSYYYTIESNQITDWPQGPMIESAGAAVMDMDTGVFLYSKNATGTLHPASTTKILTALLAVENCDLDAEIEFSEIVYQLEEGSSHLGIQPGEKLTVRDAVYGLMLASANDIANGLAEYMAGSISAFADMMNARAAELGCVNSHFANPHGLFQEDHYTCAYDMALIGQAAYNNPVFRQIVTTGEYTIPTTNLTEEERSFRNHHKMMHDDEEYYRGWCTGGKTGFTSDSLNTLVTYAETEGRRLVSVVLRVNGADKAYNESTQILQYALDNFYTQTISGNESGKTFYDLMGLRYFGDAEKMQSPLWNLSPAERVQLGVTLPYGVYATDLAYDVAKQDGKRIFSYVYNGYPVGTSSETFHADAVPAQMTYEKKTEVKTGTAEDAEPAQSVSAEDSAINQVIDQVSEVVSEAYQVGAAYTREHMLFVLLTGIGILVVLILFIILMIFRYSSDSKMKRRRKQEEKERKKREDEIDRMTAAEIEVELRKVMEQENLRRERENQSRLEAERAAEQERIMEEKAHEAERLIDELEKERQERLASLNKGKD